MAYSIRFPRRHDRATNDGLYAIRLCVTKDKRRKYIALNLYVAPEHWDELNEQFIIRHTPVCPQIYHCGSLSVILK